MQFDHSFTKDDVILKNHFIDGMGFVLPGAGYMALILDFFQKNFSDKKISRIKNIKWLKPFIVDEPKVLRGQIEPRNESILHFKFTDPITNEVFCDGLLEYENPPNPLCQRGSTGEFPPLAKEGQGGFPDVSQMTEVSVDEFYSRLQGAGYQHKGPLKCIEEIWKDENGYLCFLKTEEADPIIRLTSLLDGIHQCRGYRDVRFIPCKINEVVFYREEIPSSLFVFAQYKDYQEELSFSSLDMKVFDEKKEIVLDYRQLKAFAR